MTPTGALAAAFWLAAAQPAGGVEPVWGVQLLGGQYFFGSQPGKVNGNIAGVFTPAARLGDDWIALPTVASSYQGTKQVVDLVGAGSVFQEQMDHRLSARFVRAPRDSRWRLKPNFGWSYQLLRETRDEEWGRGLFDYHKFNAGLEAECVYREPFSVRLSADYFYTVFPNYTSLESRAGLDPQGQPLARELSGRRTLDNHAQSVSAAASAPVSERFALDAAWRLTRQAFPEQHVVDETGALTAPTREDYLNSLSLALHSPAEINADLQLLGSLEISASYATSNQHSFDARRTRFLAHYYNRGEARIAPRLRLVAGDPRQSVTWTLGGTFSHRWYPHRPVQDEAGSYQAQSLRQQWVALQAGMSYPMAPRFNVVLDFQYGRSSSNQRYELAYAYNYTVANYLFGISYDY